MIWRGVVGFIIFVIGFLLLSLVLELIFGLANFVAQNWSEFWSRIIGAAIGGAIGAGGGKIALDRILKQYPSKAIFIAFVTLNVVIIVGNFALAPSGHLDGVFWLQFARAITSSAMAYHILWLGKNLFNI